MMLPSRAAREMPIFGSYGLPLEMSLRTVPNENELYPASAPLAATDAIEGTGHRQNQMS